MHPIVQVDAVDGVDGDDARPHTAVIPSGFVAEQLSEGEGGFVLHAGDDVLVGGHREAEGGVPEPFGNDFHRDPGFE